MAAPDPVTAALLLAVEAGVFPGAALAVRVRGQMVYQRAVGRAALFPIPRQASLNTVYDLASLTKPLATASSILLLVQTGRLDLDKPLCQVLDELKGSQAGDVTARDLLSHRSGLPAWRPYYEEVAERDRIAPGFLGSDAAKQFMLRCIRNEPFVYHRGARSLYSDLGFILLGLLVERVTGDSLDRFCRDQLYTPIGAPLLLFLGKALDGQASVLGLDGIAPTEEDPWRGRLLCGEVHDENAYAMGGVAGHAGLFGTLSSVLAMSGAWLQSYMGRSVFLAPGLVRRFTARQNDTPESSWGLGWDTPSTPSTSGAYFSPQSFGHLGFTGTSLWIDPLRELEMVLLSNRVHPTRRNSNIQTFRPLIHDLVFREFVKN